MKYIICDITYYFMCNNSVPKAFITRKKLVPVIGPDNPRERAVCLPAKELKIVKAALVEIDLKDPVFKTMIKLK